MQKHGASPLYLDTLLHRYAVMTLDPVVVHTGFNVAAYILQVQEIQYIMQNTQLPDKVLHHA